MEPLILDMFAYFLTSVITLHKSNMYVYLVLVIRVGAYVHNFTPNIHPTIRIKNPFLCLNMLLFKPGAITRLLITFVV